MGSIAFGGVKQPEPAGGFEVFEFKSCGQARAELARDPRRKVDMAKNQFVSPG
jgi:hypothetical protein